MVILAYPYGYVVRTARDRDVAEARPRLAYQPSVPGPPLKGPATLDVTQLP